MAADHSEVEEQAGLGAFKSYYLPNRIRADSLSESSTIAGSSILKISLLCVAFVALTPTGKVIIWVSVAKVHVHHTGKS